MSTLPKITNEHWQAADKATGGYNYVEMCNKAIEIALAEQQEITEFAKKRSGMEFDEWQGKPPQQEGEYITAAQAQRLGFGKVLVRQKGEKYWQGVTAGFYYSSQFEYRAIKPPQPVDKHAALRAEYIRQRDAVPCELGFYLWEFGGNNLTWIKCDAAPLFIPVYQYRCTDISCYVSKDGKPAIRMLRTEAQELQRKTKDTHDWFFPNNLNMGMHFEPAFKAEGIYTYRTKATIKQPTWTGSREDVIALLKEKELL